MQKAETAIAEQGFKTFSLRARCHFASEFRNSRYYRASEGLDGGAHNKFLTTQ
jgi:hypothetical protein